MREMTMEEILALRGKARWATICTAGRDGMPYAVEATPYVDRGDVCFMINPRGAPGKTPGATPMCCSSIPSPAALFPGGRGYPASGWGFSTLNPGPSGVDSPCSVKSCARITARPGTLCQNSGQDAPVPCQGAGNDRAMQRHSGRAHDWSE